MVLKEVVQTQEDKWHVFSPIRHSQLQTLRCECTVRKSYRNQEVLKGSWQGGRGIAGCRVGEAPTVEEGDGQYGRRRRAEGQIAPSLFDKPSKNHFIFI